MPELYRICEIAFELVVGGHGRRARHRAAVRRRARRVHADGQPPRLRADAAAPTRCSIALTAARAAGRRDRQDRGPVRRARHHARARTRRATMHGMDDVEREMDDVDRGLIFANLVDFDTLYGHRNDVAGYAANLERFDARLPRPAADAARRRSAGHHRRSRQRSDHAEHRSLARVRAAARDRARACARGRRPRRARDLRRPRADARRAVRRRPARRTARASSASCSRRSRRWQVTRAMRRIREQLEAARARDPRAAGGAERRHARPAAARARGPDPAGVPARPRPHHPLQGVPAAEAQDAGVLRAGRRSLPHAADAHARGVADRAHHRQGAAACTRS